jgi:hypothetical protein
MLEGFWRREDRAAMETARLGTWTLAPYQKSDGPPLTVDRLLGRDVTLYPEVDDDGGHDEA